MMESRSWKARDGWCLLSTCVPTARQRLHSGPGLPAQRTTLCLGAHKRFLYFLQSSLHCKARAWGKGGGREGGMLNHTGEKKKSNKQPPNTFTLQSLQIKISHGNLDRCSVTRSSNGSPLPYIADPYLSCCGFHSAGSHSRQDLRLGVAETQQMAFCCGRHGEELAPGAGHLLGRETSAHQPRGWPRAWCAGASMRCQRHLVTEIPLSSCAQTENSIFS